jgi:sporulation protein YlmC with PRC-barrel domain
MSRFRLWIAAIGTLSLISGGVGAQDELVQNGLVRASKMTGMDVRNPANENLGDIEDVVLDRERGTIAYAVVSFGGFLKMGDKFFAIPWEALKPTTDRAAFVLNVPKDKLEKAPGFDKNKWPNMADPKWATELRTFYGTTAVDARDASPEKDRDATARRADKMADGMAPIVVENGNGAVVVGTKSIVVHNGKVKTFQRVDPALVVITTEHGDVQAELGPMSFMDRERLTFDSNAILTVKGYETMKNGRRTFVATEVTKDGRVVRLRRDDMTPVWTDTVVALPNSDAPSALHDVTGTVTYVEVGACESAQGRQVTLRTADGDRVIGLGPGTYLDSQRWAFRTNETVTVRGYDYGHNGSRIFVATEVRKGNNETWRLRADDGTPVWR